MQQAHAKKGNLMLRVKTIQTETPQHHPKEWPGNTHELSGARAVVSNYNPKTFGTGFANICTGRGKEKQTVSLHWPLTPRLHQYQIPLVYLSMVWTTSCQYPFAEMPPSLSIFHAFPHVSLESFQPFLQPSPWQWICLGLCVRPLPYPLPQDTRDFLHDSIFQPSPQFLAYRSYSQVYILISEVSPCLAAFISGLLFNMHTQLWGSGSPAVKLAPSISTMMASSTKMFLPNWSSFSHWVPLLLYLHTHTQIHSFTHSYPGNQETPVAFLVLWALQRISIALGIKPPNPSLVVQALKTDPSPCPPLYLLLAAELQDPLPVPCSCPGSSGPHHLYSAPLVSPSDLVQGPPQPHQVSYVLCYVLPLPVISCAVSSAGLQSNRDMTRTGSDTSS